MNPAPNIYTLENLLETIRTGPTRNGVPARPAGFYSIGRRLMAAWLVLTGRADALRWPDDQ